MRIEIHTEKTDTAGGETVVFPAGFLERNLAPANGEYLKIYLLLLQAAQAAPANRAVTPDAAASAWTEDDIADRLNITVKDVRRALGWWKNRGEIETRRAGDMLVVTLTPERAADAGRTAENAASAGAGTAEVPAVSPVVPEGRKRPDALLALQGDHEFSQLLFVIETYRKEKLSRSHLETIAYWYDELGMPVDLIESIVESCAEAGHTSMHYIAKAVLQSHQDGIRTVEEWKARNRMFRKDFYQILKAFGIRNRAPVEKERKIMEVWISDYGFSMDIIEEAAARSVHKESPLQYANSILKGWHEANVRTLNDIAALDQKHRAAAEEKADRAGGTADGTAPRQRSGAPARRGGFTDIPQRESAPSSELLNELRGRNGNLV